ncbi:MAG TPA: hypothetical protein VGE22_09005 [Solimonas sp.]
MQMKHWFARVAVVATALFTMAPVQAGPGDPLGAAFTVTTSAGSGQPQVARDAAGNFLVVWQTELPAPTPPINARRYYANGTPQGPEFAVAAPGNLGTDPRVAMDAAGNYVIAWRASEPGTAATLILARTFNASNAPLSPVLQVARLTQNAGYHSVAMGPDGRFVVVWNNFVVINGPIPGQDEVGFGLGYSTVQAHRYNLNGSGGLGNILVNTSLTNPVPLLGIYNATPPKAAMDAQGNFVVVWEDRTVLTTSVVHAQRYRASGLPAGLKTRINPTLPLQAFQPAVAMDHAGAYLIAWHTPHNTGGLSSSGYDLWARRYSAAGLGQGAAFQLNTAGGISIQESLGVARDADGDSVIAWTGSPADSCCIPQEVDIQRYGADGSPRGGKTTVRGDGTEHIRIVSAPTTAMDAYGNVVVVWYEPDGVLMGRLYQAY